MKKCLSLTILLVVFSFVMSFCCFANNITVVGDSYANCFRDFVGEEGYTYKNFFFGGLLVKENVQELYDALLDENDYILFSTGINDHANDTPPEEFERILVEWAEEAAKKQKVIFTHSYMDYPISNKFKFKYKVSDYDQALRNVAQKMVNFVYIDTKMFEGITHIQKDLLHYDKDFYDYLKEKLDYLVKEFDDMFKKAGWK